MATASINSGTELLQLYDEILAETRRNAGEFIWSTIHSVMSSAASVWPR